MEDKDIEYEWSLFTASVAAAASCGFWAVYASMGSNPRTARWMPEIREAIRLKKKAFTVLLTWRTPETVAGYHRPGRGQLWL